MAEEQDTGQESVQDDAAAVADAIKTETPADDASIVADATIETPAEWSFADGIAGEGEVPEWFKADKYKTVSDQAKAYKDLEGRFGSFTGAPETYADVELREELKEMGIEIAKDDPLMGKALAFAKDSNMNQDGFNKMVELYAETMAAESMAMENFKQEQLAALGPNGTTRINNLNAWASANMSADMIEGFQGLATTADNVKTLERLVAMTRSAPVNANESTPATGITETEIHEMQFAKDEHGNRRIHTDKAFGKKYREMRDRFYGTEDHVVTIGR